MVFTGITLFGLSNMESVGQIKYCHLLDRKGAEVKRGGIGVWGQGVLGSLCLLSKEKSKEWKYPTWHTLKMSKTVKGNTPNGHVQKAGADHSCLSLSFPEDSSQSGERGFRRKGEGRGYRGLLL
jgi:hypothetical protein